VTGWETFEEYCREQWNMERRRAYQLMDAAQVVENVYHGTQILPTSERQARPLTSLEPAEQVEAWKLAVETLEGHRGGFSPKAAGKRANDIELYEFRQTFENILNCLAFFVKWV